MPLVYNYLFKLYLIKTFIALSVFFQLGSFETSYAQSADELRLKIADKNTEIKKLETEIGRLDRAVKSTQSTKQTLGTELRQIDAIKKKLAADIKLTSKKIDVTALNINIAENNITDKNQRIRGGQSGIA